MSHLKLIYLLRKIEFCPQKMYPSVLIRNVGGKMGLTLSSIFRGCFHKKTDQAERKSRRNKKLPNFRSNSSLLSDKSKLSKLSKTEKSSMEMYLTFPTL